MSKTKKTAAVRGDDDGELALLKKMTRLLEIVVRLNLQNMKGDRSQNDMISLLDSAGCGQSEIAVFLGTTTNTVNVSLYKSKEKLVRNEQEDQRQETILIDIKPVPPSRQIEASNC
jgi:DNA-directed RNA polymerase specialized sigma24 family protein